jgi:hypothetical protein
MDVFAIAAVCSTASAAQPEILPLEMLRLMTSATPPP